MSDVIQCKRHMFILEELNSYSEGLSIKEIHNKVIDYYGEISERTIRRDLEILSCNYPIYECKSKNPVKYALTKYSIDSLSLSFKEIYSLTMAQILLREHAMDEDYSLANQAIQKICKHSLNDQRRKFDDLLSVFLVQRHKEKNKIKANDTYTLQLLTAIQRKVSVKIEYNNFSRNRIEERIIDPYYFVIREGNLHLIAYCGLRKEIRDFRVSRIDSIEELSNRFERQEELISQHEENRFVNISGSKNVEMKLKFKKELKRYICEYESNKADSIEDFPDGSILFTKSTSMSDEVKRWILGYGYQVEVLEPKELKIEIKEIIRKMVENYSGL